MVTLTQQAETVASKRYYLKDESGEPEENANTLLERVAKAIASSEKLRILQKNIVFQAISDNSLHFNLFNLLFLCLIRSLITKGKT